MVSFMLPNWHEAATIYLATHLAGMIANPILPSLRDRELLFVLEDVRSRLIFVPDEFRGHDYGAMMTRITPRLSSPPTVVTVRGERRPRHVPYRLTVRTGRPSRAPVGRTGCRAVRAVHIGDDRNSEGRAAHPELDPRLIRQLGPALVGRAGRHVSRPVADQSYRRLDLRLRMSAVAGYDGGIARSLGCRTSRSTSPFGKAAPTWRAPRLFWNRCWKPQSGANTRLPALKVFVCGGASVPPSLVRKGRRLFRPDDRHARLWIDGGPGHDRRRAEPRENPRTPPKPTGAAAIAEVKLVDASGRAPRKAKYARAGPQMLVGYLHAKMKRMCSMTKDTTAPAISDAGWTTSTWSCRDARKTSSSATARTFRRKRSRTTSRSIRTSRSRDRRYAATQSTGERACAAIVPKHPPAPDVADLRAFLKALGVASFKTPEQVFAMESLPKNDAAKDAQA